MDHECDLKNLQPRGGSHMDDEQEISLQLVLGAPAGGLVSVFPGEDSGGSLHMQHGMPQRKPVATQSSSGTCNNR